MLVEIGVDTDRDGDTDATITATDKHPIWAADPATVDRWGEDQPTSVEPLAVTAPDPTTTPDGSGSGGGGPPTDIGDPGGPLPGEWVDAVDLQPGQLLHTSTGTWTQITTIAVRTQHATVHNLTVTGPHTYHVLADTTPVLVHNCSGTDIDGIAETARKRSDELHSALDPVEARKRTTSVISAYDGDGNIVNVVSASGRGLSRSQRSMLSDAEFAAPSLGRGSHAEMNSLAYIQNQGWTPIAGGASRNVCDACAVGLQDSGARLFGGMFPGHGSGMRIFRWL